MSKRFMFLVSLVLVLGLVGRAFALNQRWIRDDQPGVELDWNSAYTWWDDPVPTADSNAYIDGWDVDCKLDASGTCAQLRVGDWYSLWWDGRPTFNIYTGANLLIDTVNGGTGNFELGVQPYRDWGDPNAQNHGWGIVTMTGGTVTVEGELAVGVAGVGEFYLTGGTIQAESFSMGTPRNATPEEDPDRVVDYDFDWRDNIMNIYFSGKLILAGNITSLDPRVVGYGGTGYLVFDYEADVAGYTTITADHNTAWFYSPADWEAVASTAVTLKWFPGRYVQDVNGHEVYFGTDFNDVNTATTASTGIYQGAVDVNYYDVSGIVDWDKTYFWRIDEVNETNTRWKGPVWRFTVPPAAATNPSPGDGTWDISILTDLTWTAGAEAVTHKVYFSTDFNDVNDRLISPVVEGANSHSPGPLEFWTTYYWAVDEVNLSADPNTWPGPVWSFATMGYLSVDDMDSYGPDPAMRNVWKDRWSGIIPKNKAEIFVETNPDLVSDGNSMRYYYMNFEMSGGNPVGCTAEADTVNLEAGMNWTAGGVEALVLYFHGDTANGQEPHKDYTIANDRMWMSLEDGDGNEGIVRYPDMNHVKEASWHEWNIDLQDPCLIAVDMNNVVKVYLGFGGVKGGAVSKYGAGYTLYGDTVWFDDIEVWPPRCISEFVAADFTGDCVTDIWDLDAMTYDWLEIGNYDVNAQPAPNDAAGGLLVWYKFDETSGTTATDSSDGGNNGVVNLDGYWDPNGYDGNGCLNLDSTVNVQAPNDMFSFPMNEVTVSMWLKVDSLPEIDWRIPFSAGDDQDWFLMVAMASQPNSDWTAPVFGYYIAWRTPYYDHPEWGRVSEEVWYEDFTQDAPVGWHHYAFIKNTDIERLQIYLDGEMVAQGKGQWYSHPIAPVDPNNTDVLIGDSAGLYQWGAFPGKIDDFRIYDHVLPHSQIVDLAGQSSVFQPFLPSAALLDLKKDGVINFGDYVEMADNWLKEPALWP